MENEKKIDSEYKERVEREKKLFSQNKENETLEADFESFITSLGMQAMIALGEIENPVTNQKEENLKEAKYLIDLLGIIREKTKNNLNKEEANLLDNLLYQLRMIFLEKNK